MHRRQRTLDTIVAPFKRSIFRYPGCSVHYDDQLSVSPGDSLPGPAYHLIAGTRGYGPVIITWLIMRIPPRSYITTVSFPGVEPSIRDAYGTRGSRRCIKIAPVECSNSPTRGKASYTLECMLLCVELLHRLEQRTPNCTPPPPLTPPPCARYRHRLVVDGCARKQPQQRLWHKAPPLRPAPPRPLPRCRSLQ